MCVCGLIPESKQFLGDKNQFELGQGQEGTKSTQLYTIEKHLKETNFKVRKDTTRTEQHKYDKSDQLKVCEIIE